MASQLLTELKLQQVKQINFSAIICKNQNECLFLNLLPLSMEVMT